MDDICVVMLFLQKMDKTWVDLIPPNLLNHPFELRLIVGEDVLLNFARWREPLEVVRLAGPFLVAQRHRPETGVYHDSMVCVSLLNYSKIFTIC